MGRMSASDERPRLRSLADDLRLRSQADLETFIRERIDAADPVPTDLASLASAAGSQASISKMIDRLPAPDLAVLQALCGATAPISLTTVGATEAEQEHALPTLQRLWNCGLVWGERPTAVDSPVNVLSAVRDVLDRTGALPASPGPLMIDLPPIESRPLRFPATVDGQAGQNALASVMTTTTLLEAWSLNPPTGLKSGGLAVRDLQAVTELLGVDELTAAFWVELVAQAGLIAAETGAGSRIAPTFSYDTWRTLEPAAQWAPIARAWLRFDVDVDATTTGVGQRAPVLAGAGGQQWRVELRQALLDAMAEVPVGEVADYDSLISGLAARRPRARQDRLHAAVASSLREAELLGVTAQGALSSLGRALIDPATRSRELVAVIAEQFPAVAEEFFAQADLTLVVPGPPSPALRQLLDLVADVESTGGAIVYRVTPNSASRALSSGLNPEDVLSELSTRSATELPQPLRYLIADAARRHNGVRIGGATSWLTCDDETVVVSMMSDPRASVLGLRRVSSSVVVSDATANELIEFAADCGYLPTAVAASGEEIVHTRTVHRAPDIAPEDAVTDAPVGADVALVSALAHALRRAEQPDATDNRPVAPQDVPRMPTAATAGVLRRAMVEQEPVWIGYADNAGSMSRRLVDVLASDAGAISVFDHNQGRIRTLVLSRITGAITANEAKEQQP